MEEQEQVIDSYRNMYRCMITKDIASLDDVLDSSFVLVHMTGMSQPKTEFLQSIKNGTLIYYSASHENIRVDIQENHATLIGKSLVQAAVFGGGKGTWRLQLTIQYAKTNNRWLMTETKASTYSS